MSTCAAASLTKQTALQCAQLTGQLFVSQGYSYVPPFDDEALMEAVYSRGTIAISLDASQPSFRFYASGLCLCHLHAQQEGRGTAGKRLGVMLQNIQSII